MKKNIYVSIICFFLLVMMFSGVMIYRHFKEAHTQEEIYDSLVEIVEENEISEDVNTTEGEVVMLSEYAKLYEQNSDIVGWIRIDDTQMNYPVMQSPQEPNFYLKHGFDKANALIKRLCANYDGGNCLLLDDGEPCVCVQSISYSLLCKYFRNAVLPAEPKLEAEILMSGAKTVCERCGVPIEKHSNRQKYCTECARIMYLKNKAKYQRNKRSGVDN